MNFNENVFTLYNMPTTLQILKCRHKQPHLRFSNVLSALFVFHWQKKLKNCLNASHKPHQNWELLPMTPWVSCKGTTLLGQMSRILAQNQVLPGILLESINRQHLLRICFCFLFLFLFFCFCLFLLVTRRCVTEFLESISVASRTKTS